MLTNNDLQRLIAAERVRASSSKIAENHNVPEHLRAEVLDALDALQQSPGDVSKQDYVRVYSAVADLMESAAELES